MPELLVMKTKEELSDKALEQVTGGAAGIGDNDELIMRIIGLLKNQLDLNNIDILGRSTIAGDLGADSLDVVDIVQAIEEEFKISLPESRVFAVKTVEDLCNLVEECLGL